jgi:hypothetical protein
MDKEILDLYTDYLLVSTAQTTATGMSDMLEGSLSHDKITRFLSKDDFTSKDLWKLVKSTVREIEKQPGLSYLILDDTVEAKPYTDENELICWHFDHTVGKSVKGVNQLSCLLYRAGVSLPVGMELIKKDRWITDKKTGKQKRVASTDKQTLFRKMVSSACQNLSGVDYVLADTWFASAENMRHIKEGHETEFIMPLKTNRKVVVVGDNGTEKRTDQLQLQEGQAVEIHLEQVDFPLLLTKAVYHNKDGSQGVLYLVSSDLSLSGEQIKDVYSNRWKVEEMYKSVKSNASYPKSPTKTVRTQANHFFCSMVAFWKLERLKMKTNLNHFAMKAILYKNAVKIAFKQLSDFKAQLNIEVDA